MFRGGAPLMYEGFVICQTQLTELNKWGQSGCGVTSALINRCAACFHPFSFKYRSSRCFLSRAPAELYKIML